MLPSVDATRARRTLITLAIAAVGGSAFGLMGLPAGWMTGGMTAVAISAMARVPVDVPKPIQTALFILIGSLLGTSVSPELLGQLHKWPISLAVLFVNVLAVQLAAEFFLRRIYRWDAQTSFFAAVPGLTSYVIALALPTRADISRIAVSQTIRVFLLVLLLPNLLAVVGGATTGAAQPVATPLDAIATVAIGAVGGVLMPYTGIPAAQLIGAMLTSGLAHGFGILHGGMPLYIQVPVYIALGAMIGIRFSGTSLATLLSILMPSLGSFLVGVLIAAFGAWLTSFIAPAPLSQLMLAFAPGGIDIMTTVAFAMHLDSAFVAAHQLARFLAITIYVPFLLARIGGGPPRPGSPT